MTPVVIDDGGGAIAVSEVSAAADWAPGPPRRRPANESIRSRATDPAAADGVARQRRAGTAYDIDMKGGDRLVV